MKALMNADSQQQYDDLTDALLETEGNDKENLLYKNFMRHWGHANRGVGDVSAWWCFPSKEKFNNRLESK